MADSDIDYQKEAERYQAIKARVAEAHSIFTPTQPVQLREIFSGRTDQLFECINITEQVGLHGILYGERGVGKTSIANMVHIISKTDEENSMVQKLECASTDTFAKIIRQVYSGIKVTVVRQECGFGTEGATEESISLTKLLPEKPSYDSKDVATVLAQTNKKMLVILDEFDRLDQSIFSLSSFTELLKILSDTHVPVNFLIVGVGESVEQIIGNHPSIVRNLSQIKLGSMLDSEIKHLVSTGMKKLGVLIDETLVNRIAEFSCGYPHYAHLLSLHAVVNALRAERGSIDAADLDFAVSRALTKAQESIRNSYHEATRANRPNIYKEVLQCCGEVELDEYNTFVPKDLERYLSAKLKRPMKATQFGAHLINFCKAERGSVLVAIGEKGRARYRFRDPLMRAYVRLQRGVPR